MLLVLLDKFTEQESRDRRKRNLLEINRSCVLHVGGRDKRGVKFRTRRKGSTIESRAITDFVYRMIHRAYACSFSDKRN